MVNIDELREIIQLIDHSSIHEFTLETDNEKIKLKKADKTNHLASPEDFSVNVAHNLSEAENKNVSVEEKENNDTVIDEVDYDHEIVSPMVGTIYHAPSPESEPYVKIGSTVTENSVVCIVEAMKLFNEIEAEVNGEIVEVLVENGELVEYGQPLYRVKTK